MASDSGNQEKARTYRLVLRGELGDRFAPVFEGMQLARREGTTVLTGDVLDQAHLSGLIERAQELGLELVSVEPINPPAAGGASRPSSAAEPER